MTTRRRPSEAVISADMTITQINRLPVATLKLQLDQFRLPHGGNKKAIVRRLYDHLQEQHPPETDGSGNVSSSSSESDSSGGEDDAGSGTAEGDDAGSSKSTSTRDPFTKSQQKALERTVKSLLRDSDHTKGRHALSLSHNSGRKSHHHRNLLSIHRSTSVVTFHLSHLPNAVVTRLAPLQLVQSPPLVHPPVAPPVAAIQWTTYMVDTIKAIAPAIGITPIRTAITNTTITEVTTKHQLPLSLCHVSSDTPLEAVSS